MSVAAHAVELKEEVREFWQRHACGEVYARGESLRQQLDAQARARYELEPHIFDFARFETGAGRDVLEIGVGLGADHLEWARHAPRRLCGVDITARAVECTRARLLLHELPARVAVGDAERLPFADASFDVVYSYGVLHHTPDTEAAVREVHRVLRPGGVARIMLYQRRSPVACMLWLRYALLAGRPWRSLSDVLAHHLESPGTRAFTLAEARGLFAGFARADLRTRLSFGDLLRGQAGRRHGAVGLARLLWPRALVRLLFRNRGLLILVEAVR